MKESQRDKDWLLYLCKDMTHITIKYVAHKHKGTTVDIYMPTNGYVLLPFVIRGLPVNIEKVYYKIK